MYIRGFVPLAISHSRLDDGVIHIDPKSKLAKIIIVVGIPLYAVFLFFQVVAFYHSIRSCNWPKTTGLITQSELDKVYTGEGAHNTAKISYRYSVNGTQFVNNVVSFGLFRGMLTWGDADRKLRDFPIGKSVDVYYDRKDPGTSCLIPGGLGWEDCFMLPVGIGGIWMGFANLKKFGAWLVTRTGRGLPRR
jgi:Protein of unknown function (DUF3592)